MYNNKSWAYSVPIAPITWGTDHATTMTAIVNAINSVAGAILTATKSGDVITLTANKAGIDFNVTDCVITGGASVPVVAIATTNAFSGSNIMKMDVDLMLLSQRYIRFNVTHTITGGGSALQTGLVAILYGAQNLPIV
ncbi:MAG: hypothetical protein HQK93_07190 [Nitrospirae bacterium]|nr:hypothetical protein [Nitrospirota bacterium]